MRREYLRHLQCSRLPPFRQAVEAFKLRSKRYDELGEKMIVVSLFVQIIIVSFLVGRSVLVGFSHTSGQEPNCGFDGSLGALAEALRLPLHHKVSRH